MNIMRIPTRYEMQVSFLIDEQRHWLFDSMWELSCGKDVKQTMTPEGAMLELIWRDAEQMESRNAQKDGKPVGKLVRCDSAIEEKGREGKRREEKNTHHQTTVDEMLNQVQEQELPQSLVENSNNTEKESKPRLRDLTEEVNDVYSHFYSIFLTETKYKYPQDSRTSIEFWLKNGYTVSELKDSATVYRAGLDKKFNKSARYFYSCKKTGKDYKLFANFLGIEPEDELSSLLNKLEVMFDEANLSQDNRDRVMAGQYPDIPWDRGDEAKELARDVFKIKNKQNG